MRWLTNPRHWILSSIYFLTPLLLYQAAIILLSILQDFSIQYKIIKYFQIFSIELERVIELRRDAIKHHLLGYWNLTAGSKSSMKNTRLSFFCVLHKVLFSWFRNYPSGFMVGSEIYWLEKVKLLWIHITIFELWNC